MKPKVSALKYHRSLGFPGLEFRAYQDTLRSTLCSTFVTSVLFLRAAPPLYSYRVYYFRSAFFLSGVCLSVGNDGVSQAAEAAGSQRAEMWAEESMARSQRSE